MKGRWQALVLALALAGCPARARMTPYSEALLALGEEARDALDLAIPPRGEARASLRTLVERLAPARRERGAALQARLNALVFDELGFRRDLRDASVEGTLLAPVLKRRLGSCTGLGALYLALGAELQLPLRGVLLPGHFYVRIDPGGPAPIDFELLRGGATMPPSWYRARYATSAPGEDYGRSLTREESLAVFRYNLANAYARAGKRARAIAIYEEVTRRLPAFAAAHAQLGLLFARRGDVARARRALERARAAHPELPGLDEALREL